MEYKIKFDHNINDAVFVVTRDWESGDCEKCQNNQCNHDCGKYIYRARKKPTLVYSMGLKISQDYKGRAVERVYYTFHTPLGGGGKYAAYNDCSDTRVFKSYAAAKKAAERLNNL